MTMIRVLRYLAIVSIVLQQGILIIEGSVFCTDPVRILVPYNLTTHLCVNGTVVPREPVKIKSKSPDLDENKSKYRGPCASKGDEFKCGRQQTLWCGWDKGMRCCAQKPYDPAYSTCCAMTEYNFEIYNNDPEKDHVCCGKTLYPRIPEQIKCKHPAKNDPFWSATSLPAANRAYKLCPPYKYGYVIKFRVMDEFKYNATMREFTFSSDYTTMYKASAVTKPMRADRYSPKTRLSSLGRFIVLTKTEMPNGLDFFLRSKDLVIRVKSRKSKTAKKRLRKAMKLMRKC